MPKRCSAKTEARIVRLAQEGRSLRAIAAVVKLSHEAVRNVLNRNGIVSLPSTWGKVKVGGPNQ